ncbi:MAG: hypothetical protein CMF41_04770 [Legionellales bacterium]|nr:hypothetical protein [Legionellales bacterium]OUX64792.1 MAG: hypothetical protein CBE41_02590 [Gammaproteobacteria bacterium TMED281]
MECILILTMVWIMIDYLIKNKIISTLLTFLTFVFGVYSALMLNIQFMPTFEPDVLVISVIWPEATAEELYESVVKPIQNEIRSLPNLITSEAKSTNGSVSISVEFKSGIDLDEAMEDMKTRVESLTLPTHIEDIKFIKPVIKEDILGLILHGPELLDELRFYAIETEEDLLTKSIDNISIYGLPDQILHINVNRHDLVSLRLDIGQIANLIQNQSNNIAIGELLTKNINVTIKSPGEIYSPSDIDKIAIKPDFQNSVIQINQIATVSLDSNPQASKIYYNGKPAVSLHINRLNKNGGHILSQVKAINQWISNDLVKFSSTIQITKYSEQWKKIYDRISILVKNGIVGCLCILVLLNVFFYRRLAFWVSLGIPISISTAIFFIYLSGGSINFLSTFALIMCLGIIVDDTIVVSEQAFANLQADMPPFEAVAKAVKFMFKPIIASSLTTVSAFIPLLVIKGLFGQILFSIPFVVICVILASIIECFIILPHHLYHSFLKKGKAQVSELRKTIDQKIHTIQFVKLEHFLNQVFSSPVLSLFSVSIILIIPFFALSQGLPRFEFFPSPPPNVLLVNTIFYPGVSEDLRLEYLFKAEKIVQKVNKNIGKPIKNTIVGLSATDPYGGEGSGGQYDPRASFILLDTVDIDQRKMTNEEIFDVLRKEMPQSDIIESQLISPIGSGPPRSDLQILIQGKDPIKLKEAANELKKALHKYKGVSNIVDNFPYGMEEYEITVKPEAQFFGISNAMISKQLQNQIHGREIQNYANLGRNVDVVVRLDKESISHIEQIEQLPIITQNNHVVTLNTVADIKVKQSFNNYNSYNGFLSVLVSAEIDRNFNNSGMLIKDLSKKAFPSIEKKYPIQFNLNEQSKYGKEALEQIKFGAVIGLFLIYAILAWSSNSFIWPFVMMLVIPFGLAGAVIGHIIMGYDMTLMSIFGMFGLTGIVINNAIILQHRFQAIQIKHPELSRRQQIIRASCQRFRSIVLTTLSTVAGLAPLMLETSLSARFLIPMAISISFGLLLANILLILVLPALMNIHRHPTQNENIDYS